MPLQTDGTVTENRRIKPFCFALGIYCPPIADRINPGQFVMLKVSDDHSPLLRRPFSVYKNYPEGHPEKKKRGHLFILYKEVGRGTRKMTSLRKGQRVDLIGPLGNGFTLPALPSSETGILVGGGMGIVSLYPLVEAFEAGEMFVFVGGKTERDVLCIEDFRRFNSNIFVATEDGSLGFKGTVVDLFLSQEKGFGRKRKHYLYACGPTAMLKALAGAVRAKNFVSYASLEARMGCGFGACWGCVVKTKHLEGPYQRVCEDGPVFRLEDIIWE